MYLCTMFKKQVKALLKGHVNGGVTKNIIQYSSAFQEHSLNFFLNPGKNLIPILYFFKNKKVKKTIQWHNPVTNFYSIQSNN